MLILIHLIHCGSGSVIDHILTVLREKERERERVRVRVRVSESESESESE